MSRTIRLKAQVLDNRLIDGNNVPHGEDSILAIALPAVSEDLPVSLLKLMIKKEFDEIHFEKGYVTTNLQYHV